MDYDIVLISQVQAVGITLTQAGQDITATSTILPASFFIFNDGFRLIYVTPFGAYLPGNQISVTRSVLSIAKCNDAAFYVIQFAGGSVSPAAAAAAGIFDFSNLANSVLIPVL